MIDIDDKIRFQPDRELYQELMEDKTINTLAQKRIRDAELDSYRRHLLGHSLRVTRNIAPKLFDQVETAKAKLGLADKHTEVYIYSDQTANASCSYLGGDKIVLTFSSGLLQSMSDDEINFIVGHELGHALFEHYSLPSAGILNEEKIDADLALKLMSWSRRAEISADRAGLYVCGKPEAAISSFLKLSCGVAHPVISFNVNEYVEQIKDIEKLANNLEDTSHCYSSHPFNPIRVLAVDLYAKHKIEQQIENTASIDQEIQKLLSFMEPVSEGSRKKIIDECALWGGLWVAYADGQFAKEEAENLQESIDGELFNQAAAEISSQTDPAAYSKEKFMTCVQPLLTLAAPDKCAFIQKLVVVARSDKNIDDREVEVLHQICDTLSVERSFVQQILMFLD